MNTFANYVDLEASIYSPDVAEKN